MCVSSPLSLCSLNARLWGKHLAWVVQLYSKRPATKSSLGTWSAHGSHVTPLCAHACLTHPGCVSFNYENGTNGVCELNGRRVDTSADAPPLSLRTGHVFGQLAELNVRVHYPWCHVRLWTIPPQTPTPMGGRGEGAVLNRNLGRGDRPNQLNPDPVQRHQDVHFGTLRESALIFLPVQEWTKHYCIQNNTNST